MSLTGTASKFYKVIATSTVTAAGITNSGTSATTGAATFASTVAVTGALSAASTAAITGNTTIGGTLAVTGAVSLTAPLTAANVRDNIARTVFTVAPGTSTIADAAVHKLLIAPGRAGIVTKISVAASVPPAGGTNTVTFLKNGATAMTAATLDPTTLVAHTITAPALHGTAANYTFTATDTFLVTWTAGTQTTDAEGVTVSIEVEFTDY